MPPDTATRLRQLRKARKLSQVVVAAAVGTDRSMLSKMENGTPGGRETYIRLAEFYGVSLDWLLAEEGTDPAQRMMRVTDAEAEAVEQLRALPEDIAESLRKLIMAAKRQR